MVIATLNNQLSTINFLASSVSQVAIFHAARLRLSMPAELSAVEREVIVLRAVYALIDDMVNFVMLSISGTDPHSE